MIGNTIFTRRPGPVPEPLDPRDLEFDTGLRPPAPSPVRTLLVGVEGGGAVIVIGLCVVLAEDVPAGRRGLCGISPERVFPVVRLGGVPVECVLLTTPDDAADLPLFLPLEVA